MSHADTANKFGVDCTADGRIRVTRPPVRGWMHVSPDDAINLAAWLAVIAEPKASLTLGSAIARALETA
jgi:hypothetical protein